MGEKLETTSQYGVRNFRANGAGVMNETLTPNPGVNWRILSLKLHVVATPATTEDFVVQVKDLDQSRYNTVLIKQDMDGTDDVVQHYEGFGISLLKGQSVDFDWANTDNNGWGLTVSYAGD